MTGKTYRVRVGDREYTVKVLDEQDDALKLEVEGQVIEVHLTPTSPSQQLPAGKETPPSREPTQTTRTLPSPTPTPTPAPAPPAVGGKVIKSSVPGKVVELLKTEGQEVSVNETVLKMESMKMIIEVKSPYAGRVKKVMVKPGEYVNPGTPLVELE